MAAGIRRSKRTTNDGAGIGIIIILLGQFIMVTASPYESWSASWIWTAFWDLLYFAVLVAMVVMWRPTAKQIEYGYTEVTVQDDLQEMPIS